MLSWREALVREVLQKNGGVMTETELYEHVKEEMGQVALYSALMNLEALNMIHPVTNRSWRA